MKYFIHIVCMFAIRVILFQPHGTTNGEQVIMPNGYLRHGNTQGTHMQAGTPEAATAAQQQHNSGVILGTSSAGHTTDSHDAPKQTNDDAANIKTGDPDFWGQWDNDTKSWDVGDGSPSASAGAKQEGAQPDNHAKAGPSGSQTDSSPGTNTESTKLTDPGSAADTPSVQKDDETNQSGVTGNQPTQNGAGERHSSDDSIVSFFYE
ncbi:hypothetical protein AK88_05609 [Plasmodium fragile]|uniref:Uncharacterized protein n=1 Tax=Plasmodium fragile TaxID=5857 RepID=A0A0D9QGC2_PLAFR|nr:uncharacterized protein AK88_05609 [Plasmodium fragile]KJP84756.1 hypothetical protein AK88_05609 [Plasmodium fragile]